MNRALLSKELRALLPFVWGFLGLMLVSTIHLFVSEPIDTHALTPARWMEETQATTFVVLLLFALLIGAGLLMREREDGTLLFLEGLPVSRSRIFWMKTIAGMFVMAGIPLLGSASDVIFGALARTSLDGPFPWKFVAVQTAVQLLAGAFLLSAGVMISFTRAWFALITGLLFWGYLLLRDRGGDWLALFDSYALLGATVAGDQVRMPWAHVAAHAGATVALLLAAWGSFLALGDRMQFAIDRLSRRGCVMAATTALRWLAPVVWIGALVYLAQTGAEKPGTKNTRPLGEEVFGRKETERYEFLYRSVQEKAAQPLIDGADEIYARVAAFLRAAPVPSRVVVDLASPVSSHAAGQTNWTKIRMPLTDEMDLAEQRIILGHETAHVFIEQLSEGRLSAHFNEIRCLHEGLASHVEQMLFGTDETRTENRRAVAGAWSRGKVPFELLIDNDKLTRTREPNLVYPLGEVLARALIEAHGDEAPARLLRAFAREEKPIGLNGAALWRDTMQAARLSVDRLAAAYEAACARIAEEEKVFVASLPRLTAMVETAGGRIVVRPKSDGAAPGKIVCFTMTDDPLLPQLTPLRREDDGTFTWPRRSGAATTFRYLLGWRTEATRLPVFEPWAEAPVP